MRPYQPRGWRQRRPRPIITRRRRFELWLRDEVDPIEGFAFLEALTLFAFGSATTAIILTGALR